MSPKATGTLEPADLDAQVVTAIKNGDPERYRELVERYQKLVYAVAWARLGDPDLAEEAAQVAFIKGYRHLPFLSQGSKFRVWITAIARNVAINLGWRHRSELKKRQRWALDAVAESCQPTPSAPDTAPLVSSQTLETALAELPARQKECLALFYLEGKSVAEAAAVLSLSENAFKTRLHRERAALRTKLEAKLAESLEQLRPRKNLALAIMPLIGPPPTGLIAGLAALAGKLFTSLAKVLPFLPAAPLVGFLPGILLARWTLGLDVQNFRDPEGFNARAFKDMRRKVLPRTFLLIVGLLFCFQWFRVAWGLQLYAVLCVSLLGIWQLALTRQLVINRNRYFLCSLYACFILWLSFVADLFWEPEFYRTQFCFGLFALLLALGYSYRPMRLDYSLFLRVVQGLTPEAPIDESGSLAQPLSRSEILRFARFLSDHYLAGDFRITSTEVWLRLAPVKYSPSMASLMPLYSFWTSHWRSFTYLAIRHDGRVHSHISPRDYQWLEKFSGTTIVRRADLEQRVSEIVAHALSAWRGGDLQEAHRYLGEQSEEVIFHLCPAKSKGTRMQKYFLMIVAAVSLLGAVVHVSKYGFGHTSQGFYLKPVATTEAEIRQTLASVTANLDGKKWVWKHLEYEMSHSLALPPPDWFPPPVWAQIHKRMWDDLELIARLPAGSPKIDLLISTFLSSPFLRNATIQGWITESELVQAGVTPATVGDFLRHLAQVSQAVIFEGRLYR